MAILIKLPRSAPRSKTTDRVLIHVQFYDNFLAPRSKTTILYNSTTTIVPEMMVLKPWKRKAMKWRFRASFSAHSGSHNIPSGTCIILLFHDQVLYTTYKNVFNHDNVSIGRSSYHLCMYVYHVVHHLLATRDPLGSHPPTMLPGHWCLCMRNLQDPCSVIQVLLDLVPWLSQRQDDQ